MRTAGKERESTAAGAGKALLQRKAGNRGLDGGERSGIGGDFQTGVARRNQFVLKTDQPALGFFKFSPRIAQMFSQKREIVLETEKIVFETAQVFNDVPGVFLHLKALQPQADRVQI